MIGNAELNEHSCCVRLRLLTCKCLFFSRELEKVFGVCVFCNYRWEFRQVPLCTDTETNISTCDSEKKNNSSSLKKENNEAIFKLKNISVCWYTKVPVWMWEIVNKLQKLQMVCLFGAFAGAKRKKKSFLFSDDESWDVTWQQNAQDCRSKRQRNWQFYFYKCVIIM